jgi:hypothetical protein
LVVGVDLPTTTSPLNPATTAAIKGQLHETVRKYECLAERADKETPPTKP